MHWLKEALSAAAIMVWLAGDAQTGAAQAEEGKKVECSDTNLQFDAPGFTVKCKDYSQASLSVGEVNAATKTYSLFAVSETDLTFLNVFSNHVLGGTRLYYDRRSLESDLEDHFHAKFSDWASEDDAGGYEVKRVTVALKNDEPMECVAFRKLGARRQQGVSGMTVGFACSGNGRQHAVDAMKRFVGETD